MKALHTILIIFTITSFYSCEDDDVNVGENLVYTVFEITNGNNRTFNIYTSAGTETFTANSNNFSYESSEFSPTALSGTTFYYTVSLSTNSSNINGCVDVNTKTYHDGNLYEDRSYSIGYENFPSVICDDLSLYEMYGIIAN
tara:strand:+ start:282 stop:707 length:426 start_codon:yes stop_codon:yes gene_type:complete